MLPLFMVCQFRMMRRRALCILGTRFTGIRKKGEIVVKIRKSMTTVLAMSAGAALLVTGCGTSSNSTSTAKTNTTKTTNTTASSSATPQKGGTVTVALPEQTQINWYFPLVNSGMDSLYNFQVINELYKPLLWIGSNYQIDYKSSIASKITYNAAGTVYHVYMNPKWTWSDGKPVTSKDVLFTWDLIKATSSPKAPAPWPYVGAGSGDIPQGVQSVVENGKYEFTVTLKKPANQQWFIYNGLTDLVPLPKQTFDKYPTNMTKEITYLGKNATNPKFDTVVDGPFKLADAVPSQSWTLVPNPTYPGHKALINKLVLVYEGSNAAEFSGLKTGAINVGYLDFSQLGEKSALTSMGDIVWPAYGVSFFDEMPDFNKGTEAPFMKHLYIRQALMMGQDQSAMNQALYKGYGISQYSILPPKPMTSFLDPKLTKPIYPFNIAKGKALLEKHGWKMVNGVMTKNGQQLKFIMLYSGGSTTTTDQMEILKEDWGKEGFDVILKPMPFSTLESVISNPKDASQWGMAAGQGIDWGGSYPSGGSIFGTGGGLNSGGYNNATMNALIKKTHEPAPTAADALKRLFAYEDYAAEQLPVIFTDNAAGLNVTASNVHGTQKYYNGVTGFPQFNYWWMSKSSN